MSKPRALLELMTVVDGGLVAVDVDFNSANFAARRRESRSRSRQRVPMEVETPPASTDPSFEFSAVVSYSSSSPASMVFSDGQLQAHQFPTVRSSAGSSQAASPVMSSSMGSAKAASTGRKKRVSFAADVAGKNAAKASDAQRRKGGGLLACMGSACGSSRNEVSVRVARNEVGEPAKNANRNVVAV